MIRAIPPEPEATSYLNGGSRVTCAKLFFRSLGVLEDLLFKLSMMLLISEVVPTDDHRAVFREGSGFLAKFQLLGVPRHVSVQDVDHA